MNNLVINKLCIEVTRKCNMKCLHCMRGEPQKIEVSLNIIDELFNNNNFTIKEIKELVITGGEPTLNVKALLKIIREIIENKIIIKSFNMVINGSNYSKKIIDSLNLLHNYGVSIINLICSLDQYHNPPKNEILNKYYLLSYFKANYRHLSNNDIICIGRAYKNKLGKIETYYINELICYDFIKNNYPNISFSNNGDILLDELYLTSKGLYGFHIIDSTYDMLDKLCIYDNHELIKFICNNNIKRRS